MTATTIKTVPISVVNNKKANKANRKTTSTVDTGYALYIASVEHGKNEKNKYDVYNPEDENDNVYIKKENHWVLYDTIKNWVKKDGKWVVAEEEADDNEIDAQVEYEIDAEALYIASVEQGKNEKNKYDVYNPENEDEPVYIKKENCWVLYDTIKNWVKKDGKWVAEYYSNGSGGCGVC